MKFSTTKFAAASLTVSTALCAAYFGLYLLVGVWRSFVIFMCLIFAVSVYVDYWLNKDDE